MSDYSLQDRVASDGGVLAEHSVQVEVPDVNVRRVAGTFSAAALACTSLLGATSSAAFASSAAVHLPVTDFNPAITGPPPPTVNIPANCPSFLSSDIGWALNFVSGNGVAYGTQNKNGDWGGGNAEGIGVIQTPDSTTQYTGHLHIWFGGGQNSDPGGTPTQQSENGFTLSYSGTGVAGSITINAHQHSTTNNSGIPTANVFGATVVCTPPPV